MIRILTVMCLILFLTSACTGYLSYRFYGQKVAIEEQMKNVKDKNKTLVDSYSKLETSCKIDDTDTYDYQEDVKDIDDIEKEALKDILPKASNIKKETARSVQNETNSYALSSDKLSPELADSLRKTYNNLRNKRGVSDDTR